MTRVPDVAHTKISVDIPTNHALALDAIKRIKGPTRSEVVRMLIREYLEEVSKRSAEVNDILHGEP